MANALDRAVFSGFRSLQRTAGDVREFAVSDGAGSVTVFNATVLWAQDSMKTNSVANAHGVYFADVVVTFDPADLPRVPVRGEYIESPRFQKWDIVDVSTTGGMIELSLMFKGPRA
jgi:hypothetical protein